MTNKMTSLQINIDAKLKFLTQTKEVIIPVLKILANKGLGDDAISNIQETLELCIEYGFNQGEIFAQQYAKIEKAGRL